MYNLLIVDDEEIAVRGIVDGIDWNDTPVSRIWTAYDAEEAKEIFAGQEVHILLSDIEMPNENGVELLKWVREHYPATITLFLSGHADFKFAQQAVALGCLDYLLKPIDHDKLKRCVLEAAAKVREQEEMAEIKETHQKYYEQWNKQRPLLVERLWQDIIHYRMSLSKEQLNAALAAYDIPLHADSGVRLVLISIEQWSWDWSARDEEIMTYGVKNAAAELVLDGCEGHMVQEANGILYALLYGTDEPEEKLLERCRHFRDQSRLLLHCQLSCYVGRPVKVREVRGNVEELLAIEKSNVGRSGTVVAQREIGPSDAPDALPLQVQFQDWALLLELGKRTELSHRIDEYFNRLQVRQPDYALLNAYYFGLMNMIFQWLSKLSLHPRDVFPGGEWEEGPQALKSIPRLRAWTQTICGLAADYSGRSGNNVSDVVDQVKKYMVEHLHEDFDREKIAEKVYLNPAYLSRLFRKETGRTLTDYLVELRLEKARKELEAGQMKVSDIAAAVGYTNFSHFSKLFKKATGLTPQEYRKKTHKPW